MMIREHGLIPGGIATATGYAGFWKRFAAILIDLIVLGSVGGALTTLVGLHLGGPLNALIAWLYFAGLESSDSQATIGKMALGIYVTDGNLETISFGRATLRYFAKIVSVITVMIGFLMAAWTDRKQALHDIIASTLVLSRT